MLRRCVETLTRFELQGVRLFAPNVKHLCEVGVNGGCQRATLRHPRLRSLQGLMNCRQLRSLSLASSKMGDRGFEVLAAAVTHEEEDAAGKRVRAWLPTLNELHLSDCDLTTASVVPLMAILKVSV
jgi:hypothetical protein